MSNGSDLDVESLLLAAKAIGRRLLKSEIRRGPYSAWRVCGPTGRAVQYLPWDSYSGAIGIGFFMSLLGRHTGQQSFISIGQRSYHYSLVESRNAEWVRGIVGLAGLGQCLLVMNREEEACAIARRLQSVSRQESFGVLHGSAGIGTFLLSLYRKCHEREFLDAAMRHGDFLLKSGPPWVFRGTQLIGCSHGPAGIGEFLLRLLEETGLARYRVGAEKCLELVGRYSVGRGGMFRVRVAAGMTTIAAPTWCHGSAGVMQFESAGANILGKRYLKDRVDRRAQDMIGYAMRVRTRPITYCHGIAGVVDALLECGFRAEAIRIAKAQILPRVARSQRVAIPSGKKISPGFFDGEAGVGFMLLRLVYPEVPQFYRVL